MSIPDRVSPDPELPEQHLLRGGDRLQDYAGAFLRGEITAVQYSDMTLAEINRRTPINPLLPLLPLASPPAPVRVESTPVCEPPAHPPLADGDRSIVLARAFVSGRIRQADFLRLIRDC